MCSNPSTYSVSPRVNTTTLPGPARARIIAHDLAHPAIQLPVRDFPHCSSATPGSSYPGACTLAAPNAQSTELDVHTAPFLALFTSLLKCFLGETFPAHVKLPFPTLHSHPLPSPCFVFTIPLISQRTLSTHLTYTF